MSLNKKRRAIRHLLNEKNPADAQAAYYAFHHPDEKTTLVTYQDTNENVTGYVCLSKTGIDLFRPLITMRLPRSRSKTNLDLTAAAELITRAIPIGLAAIINAPVSYHPLLGGLLNINREVQLKVFALDRTRFEPIINVFVSQTDSYNGLPRFIIRQSGDGRPSSRGEIVASAGLNWRSDNYAEMYVHTKNPYRRQGLGRSVVAALVQAVLDQGRTPLYAAHDDNSPSIQLAESVGFVETGAVDVLIEGEMRSLD